MVGKWNNYSSKTKLYFLLSLKHVESFWFRLWIFPPSIFPPLIWSQLWHRLSNSDEQINTKIFDVKTMAPDGSVYVFVYLYLVACVCVCVCLCVCVCFIPEMECCWHNPRSWYFFSTKTNILNLPSVFLNTHHQSIFYLFPLLIVLRHYCSDPSSSTLY